MGGRWYQTEAKHVVDYELFSLDGCSEEFRGPKLDLRDDEYVCFLGAAQTFGTFARYPFPTILLERLPYPILNLGIGGAGPYTFAENSFLLDKANKSNLVVIQVMSGRSAGNSLYETLDGTSALRPIGSSKPWVLAEDVWKDLHNRLRPGSIQALIEETRACYLEGMLRLFKLIKPPKILLWISKRRPADYPRTLVQEFEATLNTFPHFINQDIIDTMASKVSAYVEVVSSRGMPQLLSEKGTGRIAYIDRKNGQRFCWQDSYPSPEMHEDIANALHPVLKHMITPLKNQ